jgi:hypothetical protein
MQWKQEEMKANLIVVYAWSEEEFRDIERILNTVFDSVTCTGVNHNTREPFKGGVRGYLTVADPKEVTD